MLCNIALTPGQSSYPLHPALYGIYQSAYRVTSGPDAPQSRSSHASGWTRSCRTGANTRATAAWLSQTDTGLRPVGQVDTGEVLFVEAYRLPLLSLALPDPQDPAAVRPSPEIHEAHHEHLIQWALHQKLSSVPDSELFDLTVPHWQNAPLRTTSA